jgi:hypothetical protein
MSRLHELYDRVHDRIVQYRDPPPPRADELGDEEIAHTTLSVDQLAYGEDADASIDADTLPIRVTAPSGDGHNVVDDDDATDTGENWVEILEIQTVEDGPAPGREVDPDRDIDRLRNR